MKCKNLIYDLLTYSIMTYNAFVPNPTKTE